MGKYIHTLQENKEGLTLYKYTSHSVRKQTHRKQKSKEHVMFWQSSDSSLGNRLICRNPHPLGTRGRPAWWEAQQGLGREP